MASTQISIRKRTGNDKCIIQPLALGFRFPECSSDLQFVLMWNLLRRLGSVLDISAVFGGKETLYGGGLDEEGNPIKLFCDDGSTNCADDCVDACREKKLI
jgi:hypothetical protein